LNALLISMPGTPVFYYGDEIGMGDNVFLRDRDGVRTPMQWSFDRNGGFSRADPASLYLPPIMDSVYGFEAVNVEAQSRSPSSLLNWMKRLIAARRSRSAFGRGTLRFLYPSNRKVIAYLRSLDDEVILCVANLSRSPQAVELDLAEFRGRQPVELLGRSVFPTIGDLPYLLTLQAHSFFWFELLSSTQQTGSLRLRTGTSERYRSKLTARSRAHRKTGRHRKAFWRPSSIRRSVRGSSSTISSRSPRSGRRQRASCAKGSFRLRLPSCASSAVRAPWSMPSRRTVSHWQ
jgi:hypothetical protein